MQKLSQAQTFKAIKSTSYMTQFICNTSVRTVRATETLLKNNTLKVFEHDLESTGGCIPEPGSGSKNFIKAAAWLMNTKGCDYNGDWTL